MPDGSFRDPSPTAERGLLFMCFQRNIEKQFAFIQRQWLDSPNVPIIIRNTGDDPILGQDGNEAQSWPLKWGDDDAGRKDFNFESPVTLEGGEYFFSPSLPFLRALPKFEVAGYQMRCFPNSAGFVALRSAEIAKFGDSCRSRTGHL